MRRSRRPENDRSESSAQLIHKRPQCVSAGWILRPKPASLRPDRTRARKPILSKKLPLTLACGDYEIVRALKEGAVEPDGIELTMLTDMDSTTRHWRFIRNRDFDVAEYSCSSYVVARDQNLPVSAIPVFLHRRFRHGFVYINTGKGIAKPTDLIGRKIGVN